MDFQWTQHRFSGGLLALDLVNTVVHRNAIKLRIDRLTSKNAVERFVEGARHFRSDEIADSGSDFGGSDLDIHALISLREAIDRMFRPHDAFDAQKTCLVDQGALHHLFTAASVVSRVNDRRTDGLNFGAQCAVSAFRMLDASLRQRIKACPRCDWLFVDKSRNKSRMWCDMAVCGNRAKAGAHYRRTKTSATMDPGSEYAR